MIYAACLVSALVGAVAGALLMFIRVVRKNQARLVEMVSNDQEIWKLAGARVAYEIVQHVVVDHKMQGDELTEWIAEQLKQAKAQEWDRGVLLGQQASEPEDKP